MRGLIPLLRIMPETTPEALKTSVKGIEIKPWPLLGIRKTQNDEKRVRTAMTVVRFFLFR